MKWYVIIAIYFENSFALPDRPKCGHNRDADGTMEFT